MKRGYKVLVLLFIVIAILSIVGVVNASVTPNSFAGDHVTGNNAATQVSTFGGQIIGIVRFFGTWASVAVLIILGIKYMMGSIEEKAEYKKSMLPYVIGAVLVFAATNIVSVIYGMKL